MIRNRINRLRSAQIKTFVFVAALSAAVMPSLAQPLLGARGDSAEYTAPFFAGAQYDPAVTPPETMLGHPVGARAATSEQIRKCFETWSTQSPRIFLEDHGRTHEGRPVYHAIITSIRNQARRDKVREMSQKLADPRGVPAPELEHLIDSTPGVIWLGFSIHGDEISPADSAMSLAYYLIACQDPAIQTLLEDVVIVFDPLLNPDGRDRFLKQMEHSNGYVVNYDVQSVQHAGYWPWGRGNHYLFDMNRDWLAASQPETRGRQAVFNAWRPQALVDAHEMSAHDTYAFYPAREPFNPYLGAGVAKWWPVFAEAQGHAFDKFGWSYYSREWMDMWYPGYTDGWSIVHGAIGMLYEQAGVDGSGIRHASGKVMTYRESVHHNVICTMATVEAFHRNRKEIVADYVARKKAAVDGSRKDASHVFLIDPARHTSRVNRLLDRLARQGVEIKTADAPFKAEMLRDRFGVAEDEREFATGTIMISMQQPLADVVGAFLAFDPQMNKEFLLEERRELEARRGSKMYDISAWSLGLANDLSCYWSERCGKVAASSWKPIPPTGTLTDAMASYGYAINGSDDAAIRAVAQLMQNGVRVRVADKEFQVGDVTLPRGSFLIRRQDNDDNIAETLSAAASKLGVNIVGVETGRSSGSGPDLGAADRFTLLIKPRIAILTRGPIDTTSYGALWHHLDVELGLPVSGLDTDTFGGADLRLYNVLIIPDLRGSIGEMLKSSSDKLRNWVRDGGTLIAVGGSAHALCDAELNLSDVRLRGDVLETLELYVDDLLRERAADTTEIDMAALYGNPPASRPVVEESTAITAARTAATEMAALSEEQRSARERWDRMFAPQGVIARGRVDRDNWITAGCSAEMPVFVAGDEVLMAKSPIRTAIRLADRDQLRLSGLLWPEAAARLADSAYLTVERSGHGQIVLFAADPTFRCIFEGTTRLFSNAVVLGPGAGADAPLMP